MNLFGGKTAVWKGAIALFVPLPGYVTGTAPLLTVSRVFSEVIIIACFHVLPVFVLDA